MTMDVLLHLVRLEEIRSLERRYILSSTKGLGSGSTEKKRHHAVLDMLRQIGFICCIHSRMD